jgi:hypothetical protein
MTTETTATADKKTAPRRILDQIKVLRHWISSERADEMEREAARHRLAILDAKYVLPDENGVMPHQAGYVPGELWLYNPGAWQGAKYAQVRRMSLTDIAKLMRADLKLARKLAKATAPKPGEVATIDPIGDAPAEIKISIRTEYYSGGGAIDVVIKGVPQEWGWTDEEDPHYPGTRVKMATPAMTAFHRAVQEIHNAYNYDNSNAMVDHFERNYYGHVDTEQRIHMPRW